MYRITIVTVCYNACNGLKKTMDSVLRQDYPDIEYIIVDGASSDGTLNLIDEYKEKFESTENIKFFALSEKDSGIYDAMNKGINLSGGDWIIFMNAGDQFYNSTVVSDVFCKPFDNNITGVYGDTERYYNEWKKVVKGNPLSQIKTGLPLPFCHQSVFVRADILRKLMFDTTYKQAADYDFFLRCYNNGYEFTHVDVIVSQYEMGGVSETNTVFHLQEKLLIRERNNVEKYSKAKKTYLINKLRFKQYIKKTKLGIILRKIRGH